MRSERRIVQRERSNPAQKVWFHGASVGDLKSISPVLTRLSREQPVSPVLTYWSREAQLFAKNKLVSGAESAAALNLKPFIFRCEAPELCVFST